MAVTMAIAPDGGIAARNANHTDALTIPGRSYDPYGNIWHWTGRAPYQQAPEVARTLLQEKAPGWSPSDPEELCKCLQPERTIRLDAGDGPIAEQLATMETQDAYLMAIASAKVIMRNLTNGMTVATFTDDSKAYIMPDTMEIKPTT